MFTRFRDVNGRHFPGSALGDCVANLERPPIDSAFNGAVPCTKAQFRLGVGGREVCKRVVKEARAALDGGGWLDGEGNDLDGVRQNWGEIDLRRRGHYRLISQRNVWSM